MSEKKLTPNKNRLSSHLSHDTMLFLIFSFGIPMKRFVFTLTFILFYSISLLAQPLSSYVKDNYDVLFQSPLIKHVEEADYFLLAEYHHYIGHKHVNSMMINHYAKEGDLVFVEGVPSWQEIQPAESLQSMWISAPVKVMGWDAGWLKDLTGVDATRLEKLGLKLLQLQYDIVWNKAYEKKKEYFKLLSKVKPLLPEIQPMFDKSFEKVIADRFPERVAAMNKSLERITDKKIFLIAGLLHLWQDTSSPFFDNPKLSLDTLYEFLGKHKAVILIPKQPVTDYWKNFYQVNP